MLSRKEFDLLRDVYEGKSINSNEHINTLISNGYIDSSLNITTEGFNQLNSHKVDNAIILAAGMSTRFVPVSYEKPKGLIAVKGEVLIERIIRQLQEKNVKEIVIVVGYMMEKFLYLREKYGATLVVNNEFATKNTHSSIYHARKHLGNTYICCSDNYYPENPFHEYEYKAFYCSIFLEGISYVERAFTFDENDLIYDTNKPSNNQWIMYGHAYYDKEFTKNFVPILEDYYGRDGVENLYWENVYAQNLDKLPMYIKRCEDGEILEFDSMEELKVFDPDFITHNKIKIFENICNILNCKNSDIKDIEVIKKGLNNRSFKFLCKDKEYVYRHPGNVADGIIDRVKEASSLKVAKSLGIDKTLVYVDEIEGWKISNFINTTEEFDFHNFKHLTLLSDTLKKLHSANIQVGFEFDYPSEAQKLLHTIKTLDNNSYNSLKTTEEKMQPIINYLKNNPWQKSLCHNDIYEPNLLVSDNRLDLIDWEFAGDSDIGYDICKLFSLNCPNFDDCDEYLKLYFKRNTSEEEKLHLFACASVIYYYWFVWAIYESKNDSKSSSYMMGWYDKMNHYANIVLKYIKGA